MDSNNIFDNWNHIPSCSDVNMFVCLCLTSLQQRGHLETAPHLLSLAKDMKLGKYTVHTGNRTPGRRVTVHYATAASRKLRLMWI